MLNFRYRETDGSQLLLIIDNLLFIRKGREINLILLYFAAKLSRYLRSFSRLFVLLKFAGIYKMTGEVQWRQS